jgi:uncharacterized protein YegP (UPF0339 family)
MPRLSASINVNAGERGFGKSTLLIAGPIIRLRLQKAATNLAYLGILIGIGAVVWFLMVYPDDWVRGAEQAKSVIGVYGIGLAIVALGGIAVPLVTKSPARRTVEDVEQELETERRAREEAEADRDAEREARQTAEAEREEAEAEAEGERERRDPIEAELARIRASQSQFELYEDRGGEWRWRLRHRNGNTMADSSQGFASRHGTDTDGYMSVNNFDPPWGRISSRRYSHQYEKALLGVKRHAPGATADWKDE